MTYQARGRVGELYPEEIGDIEFKLDGTVSGSVVWFISPYELALTQAPMPHKDRHPKMERLLCQNTRVTYVKPDAARIYCDYEAGDGTSSVSAGGPPSGAMRVSVRPTLTENPITFHDKFPEWKDNAIFDETTKEFVGWDIPEGSDAEKWFEGLVSYFEASVTLVREYTNRVEPDLSSLRKIFESGAISGAPRVKERNWLLVSMPYRDLGDGQYAVTEEFLLSGPNGWNPYVYGTENL